MAVVHFSRFFALVVGICALSGLTGCGSQPKAEVSGTVKLRGQPPKFHGLQIVFMGEDGYQASAAINDDGTYKAENVPSGDVKVCFAYFTPDAIKEGAEFKASGGRKMQKPEEKEKKKTPAPKLTGKEPTTNPVREDLRDTSTSKLTVKVESGKPNTFDYDLP
jgi:hypothetical protein